MILIAIRHLPTSYNVSGLLQGKRNIEILQPDQKLLMQIQQNQDKLSQYEFDQVLVSPLARTRSTALLYNYSDPVQEHLVAELDFGSYEGKDKEVLISQTNWLTDPYSVELGETMYIFKNRIYQFIAKYSHLNFVLLFGHGAYMRALKSLESTGDLTSMNTFHFPNNSLVTYEF